MRVYTVHAPPPHGLGLDEEARRIAFVKEGFCWPALLFPIIWLIYRRMWIVLAFYIAASVGLTVLSTVPLVAPKLTTGIALLFAFWLAIEANGLRRWTLARRGWREVGVAAGRDLGEAEQSFFRRWQGARTSRAVPPAPALAAEPRVIGRFEDPTE